MHAHVQYLGWFHWAKRDDSVNHVTMASSHFNINPPCTFIAHNSVQHHWGLLLAAMNLFANVLLANSSLRSSSLKTLLGCSFCSLKWHSTTHLNKLRATIGLIDSASVVARLLEDMFSKINKFSCNVPSPTLLKPSFACIRGPSSVAHNFCLPL